MSMNIAPIIKNFGVSDVEINVGTDGGKISDSEIKIGNVAGRDAAGNVARLSRGEDVESLRQRVRELEQFVFGDERLGIMGIRQQL